MDSPYPCPPAASGTEPRRVSARVEATRSHNLRAGREALDVSSAVGMSCPGCALALYALFELTVALRREAGGGGLGAAWRLRATCAWVWEDGGGGGDASAEGRRVERAVRARLVGRGLWKASSGPSRPGPRGGAGGSRKARRGVPS